MYFANDELRLAADDIRDFCKNCGTCCRGLMLQDKIGLTAAFGRPVIEDDCPFSTKYGCIKYVERPQECREWTCGVVELLQHAFNTKCRIV